MKNSTGTTNNRQSKIDNFKRNRIRSADSISTAETATEVVKELNLNNSSAKVVSDSFLEVSPESTKWDSISNIDWVSSPYLSALNLPTIYEEETESWAGSPSKHKNKLNRKATDADSPFCKISAKGESKFENSCAHSKLMSSLWAQIK